MFRHRKSFTERLRDRMKKLKMHAEILYYILKRKAAVDYSYEIQQAVKKYRRKSRYFAEDSLSKLRRFSPYYDITLFTLIVIFSLMMVANAANYAFLNTFMAMVMLVLVIAIYSQMRFQRSLVQKYIPGVDFVKIGECEAFSDRIRTVNVYGARMHDDKMKLVRNFRISYRLMNTSFSPVSLSEAQFSVIMKDKTVHEMPPQAVVTEMGPSETGYAHATFRLKHAVSFYNVDFVELKVRGNCEKSIRVRPRLYVNVMLRGKKSGLLFEPYSSFMKRDLGEPVHSEE